MARPSQTVVAGFSSTSRLPGSGGSVERAENFLQMILSERSGECGVREPMLVPYLSYNLVSPTVNGAVVVHRGLEASRMLAIQMPESV